MASKDKVTQVTTVGTLRTNNRSRTCRSCSGTTGWQVTQQNGRTVVVHTGCGTTQ